MADINFPSQFLRLPLRASIRRDIATGFIQSSPASGTPYNRRTTFDNPVVFDIEFAIEGGKKALFYAWLYGDDALVGGIKPFNIDLEVEGAFETQEAWFTEGGVPQLAKKENGVWFYTAQIRLRKLNNPWEQQYDFLLQAAEESPGGDPLTGLEIFDIAVNEDWPEYVNYELTPEVAEVRLNESAMFTVSTENVPNGTVLRWSVSSEVNPSSNGGNITIQNNTASFSITNTEIIQDRSFFVNLYATREGVEFLAAQSLLDIVPLGLLDDGGSFILISDDNALLL